MKAIANLISISKHDTQLLIHKQITQKSGLLFWTTRTVVRSDIMCTISHNVYISYNFLPLVLIIQENNTKLICLIYIYIYRVWLCRNFINFFKHVLNLNYINMKLFRKCHHIIQSFAHVLDHSYVYEDLKTFAILFFIKGSPFFNSFQKTPSKDIQTKVLEC